MVTIEFKGAEDRTVQRLDGLPWVAVQGGLFRAGPDSREIAHLEGGVWHAASVSVAKFEVHGSRCTVQFHGANAEASVCFGPFDRAEFRDGALYTYPGPNLLSRLDHETGQWFNYQENRSWPKFVIAKCD